MNLLQVIADFRREILVRWYARKAASAKTIDAARPARRRLRDLHDAAAKARRLRP